MRKKITIPSAGVTEPFKIRGRSVVVEKASIYDNADEVPLIGFNSGNDQFPIYPRSTYQFQEQCEEFNEVRITGTAESAGDEIILISFREPLQSEINIVYSDSYEITLKDTFTLAASDAVQSIPEVNLANSAGRLPNKIYVFVIGGATRGINYAFGASPNQGDGDDSSLYLDNDPTHDATTAGYVGASKDPLEIEGINFINNFNFIATVATETPNLIITCEY